MPLEINEAGYPTGNYPKLKKGDRVKVTRVSTGVITDVYTDGTALYNRDDIGGTHTISRFDMDEDNVEVLDPENWPPQVGDIWEADGDEYTALKHNLYTTLMINIDHTIRPENTPDEFKRLNPRLVRRRTET